MQMLLLGSHCNGAGGIAMAARRAGRAGMQALQVFTAVPRFYNDRAGVRPQRLAEWRDALAAAGIAPGHVIVHAGYVLNCAAPDEKKWARAAAGLAMELERSTMLGVAGVCFHPGSATDGDREAGCARVSEAMRRALESVPEGHTRLLLENTAGAGTTLGRTPGEIALMLEGIAQSGRHRTGYGLDTCHLFASGFALNESRESLCAVLDAFERETGEVPAFFHLNDSEGARGSNRDRHSCIGDGRIGAKPFGWLLQDRRTQDVPLILETPHAVELVADDDDSPDPQDVESITLLRRLALEIE